MLKILFSIIVSLILSSSILAQDYNFISKKVEEIGNNIIKITSSDNKFEYKFINEHPQKASNINYSTTKFYVDQIDTTPFCKRYQFWKSINIGTMYEPPSIADLNKNGLVEIYGFIKDYGEKVNGIYAMEMNSYNNFNIVHHYDTLSFSTNDHFDIDNDGFEEIGIVSIEKEVIDSNNYDLIQKCLYYKSSDTSSAANNLLFTFKPRMNSNSQQNDNRYGFFDTDSLTDQINILPLNPPCFNIYEYSSQKNNFDLVFNFDYNNEDIYFGGYAIGDFDNDNKTEFLAGSIHGKIIAFENTGDNQYDVIWRGNVPTYNAYVCTTTDDLDGNGKKEAWIAGDAFYNGELKTVISIFEADGNNSYEIVHTIEIVNLSTSGSNEFQILDVDKDGKPEIMFFNDGSIWIFRFSGSINVHKYNIFYVKKDFAKTENSFQGAKLYDVDKDGYEELILSLLVSIKDYGYKLFTDIYKIDPLNNINDENSLLPHKYNLFQNYPNPFNPFTTIQYDIKEMGFVSLIVYDILGNEVAKLENSYKQAGNHTVVFDGSKLSSGTYIYSLKVNDFVQNKKMIYLK